MRDSQPRRGASPHLSPWVRGCYGLVLLTLPGPLLRLVAGHVCGTVPRRVVRLLAVAGVAATIRSATPTRPHGALARHRDAAAARVAAHTLPARVRARLVDSPAAVHRSP